MAYDRVAPFGSDRDNLHAAIVAQTVIAMLKGADGKLPQLADFMIDTERKDAQTIEQQKMLLSHAQRVAKMLGFKGPRK
jgi:hypothetical protein